MPIQILIILASVFTVLNTLFLAVLWLRKPNAESGLAKDQFQGLEKNLERSERLIREEISKNRTEANQTHQQSREELTKNLNSFGDSVLSRMTQIATLHKNQLDTFSNQLSALTQMNEQKLENVRNVVEERLKCLQEENSQKLEKMRETVDEKLHLTLEKRLGESFRQVSERLEKVHQGLGEMQVLASGVGDLKKILSNVKTRGAFGESQLSRLLEEMLAPGQYETNCVTKKGSRDPVEFAIRMPGNDNGIVYLPIDAKFPMEDYERLQTAYEAANAPQVEEAGKAMENRLKLEAKRIRDKYIDFPNTTDFALLFLPTESLYAEVLRRPGLADLLRREYSVLVTGPTTILAFLNNCQMFFRKLAVEKRAGEVWQLLGEVKTQFSLFGELLDKTQKKLQEASNTIDEANRKTKTISRHLKNVQELPATSSLPLIEERTIDAILE